MKKYKVVFTIDREVIAESEEDAISKGRELTLDWNWYYVHDYLDEGKAEVIWDPTQEELDELKEDEE